MSSGRVGLVCPLCGAAVTKYRNLYKCERNVWPVEPDSCKFVLFEDTLKHFGKESLTEEDVSVLLSGGRVALSGLVPKKGKSFSCLGELEHGEKYSGIKFIFEDLKKDQSSFPDADSESKEAEDAPLF